MYEIYKDEKRKAYAVFEDLSLTKEDMILEANRNHFKGKISDLVCESGYITKDDELFLTSSFSKTKGSKVVWAVYKK